MFTLVRIEKLSKMEDHCLARLEDLGCSDDNFNMMLPDMPWGMDEFDEEESETSWESDSWIDDDDDDDDDDVESLTSDDLAAAQLHDENSEQQDKKLIALYKAAVDKRTSIHTAWTVCRDCTECNDIEQVQHTKHRDLLHAAFARFQATHKLQHALLTSGHFASTIGHIASQLSNLHSVCFTDQPFFEFQLEDEYSLAVANTLLDDTQLLDVLSAPMRWTNMAIRTPATRTAGQSPFFHTDKTAASLLCDIPVAFARHHVYMHNLQVECAPVFRNTNLLLPQNGALQDTWQDLQRAFSSLRKFVFRPLHHQRHDHSLHLDSHRHLVEYLAACTSGNALVHLVVHLDLYTWADDDDEEVHFVDLHNALHRPADAPALTTLDLQSASMSFDQLKRLCLQLSPHAQSCLLHQIYLSNGSCADIVDVLRSILGSRAKDRTPCNVQVTAFANENTYNYYERLIPSPYTFMDVFPSMYAENVFDNTAFYIVGILDVNPLARFENPPVLPYIPDMYGMDDMESD